MASSVREIITQARDTMDDAERSNAPKVVAGLVGRTDYFYERDKPSLLLVVGAGWNNFVRSVFKNKPKDDRNDQLLLWPKWQRDLVTEVGDAEVFVPSRGKFIPLIPEMITVAEIKEAGQYKIRMSEAERRKGIALLNLASSTERGGDD